MLTLDQSLLCRKILAKSNEEVTAVQQVLNEFFTETLTGWHHNRCEDELEVYRSNTSAKALAGRASAEAKRIKRLALLGKLPSSIQQNSTAVEQPLDCVATCEQQEGNGIPTKTNSLSTNQELKNQEPIKRTREKKYLASFSDWTKQNSDPEAYSAAYEFAGSINLPAHFLEIAFFDLEEKYGDGGTDAQKKYKDWSLVFLKALKENWLKTWYKNDRDEYVLTTRGQQCETRMLARDRADAAKKASSGDQS